MQDIDISIIVFTGDQVEIVATADDFPHELIFDPREYLLMVPCVDIMLFAVRDDDLFKIMGNLNRHSRPLFHVGYCSDFKYIVDVVNVDLCYLGALAGYHAVILTFIAMMGIDDNIKDRLISIYVYLEILDHFLSFNVEDYDLSI